MTEQNSSLLDLGKISKPVSKLIDAVSQCLGTLYEPTRIRRKAKAEADASLILAKADIERQKLLQRAAHRLAVQEVRRQENIEKIINCAVSSLPEAVSSEPVDPDWVSRFFDECKDVSHEELQAIWARILAGEVSSPGSCSRRTLSILKDLNQYDSALFNSICPLTWRYKDNFFIPYNYKVNINPQLEKYNTKYGNILHLETRGLIHCKADIQLHLTYGEELSYFEMQHICHWQPPNMLMQISVIPLTESGIELFSVCNAHINWSFYVDIVKMFCDVYNLFLACPISQQDS